MHRDQSDAGISDDKCAVRRGLPLQIVSGSPAVWVSFTVRWTKTLPAGMFYTSPLQGVASNAPIVFFRANEK